MKGISLIRSARIGVRALRNYVAGKPLVVSFEVTHSCTCNCLHCDRGGEVRGENAIKPADYAALVSLLRPSVVQVSGGEPLLRGDVVDIVKAIKSCSNGFPYVILVTNGSLLDKEIYLKLKEAGVDRFSISLDFPDERHNRFRRHPGLYAHLERTVPRLAALGYDDIALNSAITRANLPCLVDLADKAEEWNVSISYSAYGILRTGNRDFFIRPGKDLKVLHGMIQRIIQLKRRNGRVLNSIYQLMRTYEFFKRGFIPGCNAGRKFLVVRPDGYMIPCSMRPHSRVYSTQEEMLREFSDHNTCGECYVAIRAYSDKPLGMLAKDSLSFAFNMF